MTVADEKTLDEMTEETVEASCETEENEAPEAAQAEGEVQEEVNAADENEAADEAEEPLSRRDKKAMAKKDDQIADLTDRLKRSMAEFDNYRKRTDKEKAAMYGMGLKDVVEKILPVVDNFERGLATVPEDKQEDAFVTGMTAVYKQFMTVLDGMGVKPIEAVGNEFDPNLHNAVMHTEDESVGENIVVEEFQKGYIYGDSVIRHSMVKVAN